MAHQTHALPWNTLASHFKCMYSHTHEPKRSDIYSLQKETEEKEIDYFCRTFAQRIREFSDTERAKYAPRETYQRRAKTWKTSAPGGDAGATAKSGGPERRCVYPDALQSRYLAIDDREPEDRLWYRHWARNLQQITDWKAKEIAGGGSDYADVLKLMMIEAAGVPPALTASSEPGAAQLQHDVMESLLLLANHPDTDLLAFVELHHGHHFGLSRVAEEGVRAYVYLNLLVAMQENGSDVCSPAQDESGTVEDPARPKYMDFLSYRRMLMSVAGTYDGDTQNLVHWDFFLPRNDRDWDFDAPKDVLADRKALVEYLKGVWRILVIYDMVIREAGGDPILEHRCKFALNISLDMRMNLDT